MAGRPAKASVRVAFCGMAVALSVVLMLMGGLIPIAVYLVPLMCGLILLPISIEFGKAYAWAAFGATAALSLLLGFDKEAAFFYLFIGYYPIVKWSFDRIKKKPLRAAAKLLLFTVSILVMYGLLNLLFPMEQFMQEFHEMGIATLIVMLVVYNISMLLFDRFLVAALMIYANRIRPRLHFLKK